MRTVIPLKGTRLRRSVIAPIAAIPVTFSIAGTLPAQEATAPAEPRTEQLVVVGERVYPVVDSLAPDMESATDTAELLRRLPGADINANGPLSGIAQYRGLYGDRVAVSLDGVAPVSGGPNAMDAPLSYASPLLLGHLNLERGIASVSSAMESLGGHVSTAYDRGQHTGRSAFRAAGKAQTTYASNGSLARTAVQLVGANDTHKLALLAQRDDGDDLEFNGGTILPTRLHRERYDLSYGFRGDDTEVLFYAGQLDTSDTGTPSLPMDIRRIDTSTFGADVTAAIGARSILNVMINASDVEHVMDNFGVRQAPASPMSYRSTYAEGDGVRLRIGATTQSAHGEYRFGIDGAETEHSATITNPNVAPFLIENFNAASRDLAGIYAEWNRDLGSFDIEAGVRYNRVEADAGIVAASIPAMSPMMEMMAAGAASLAEAFNTGLRNVSHDNVDVVLKAGRTLGPFRNVYFEIGRKTRAPSYQELYLWLPLEASGGLADGRSYIGNPLLESEVSREINIGSNWQTRRAWLAPQIFYKDIDDYIQGAPSADMTANMLATMMTGSPALQFSNTDARIYGIDLAWGYYLGERLTLSGLLSAVRGKRTDTGDRLYRLSPLNGQIALSYASEDWTVRIEVIAYAAQNQVARYNGEAPTAGYGLLSAAGEWRLSDSLRLTAAATNLLDKRYRDHLDGINRAMNQDIALRARLPGAGRSLELGLRYDW